MSCFRQACTTDRLTARHLLKPGRAFSLAASRTPRRNTKSERREATRLSSRIPYVARHTQRRRLRCAASQRCVRMCFDKQMAALSARSVGRSVVGACPPARCARARGACTCQPRNTCLGSAGAGRSSWYAFGWLALSRVGFFFGDAAAGCWGRLSCR